MKVTQRLLERGGGLAAWSIHHPIGVIMIALAIVLLGLFAAGGLQVNLLPHIIYPEVRVRILNPGVPAQIMEDQYTRQLEEQLAITENAIYVQSRSSLGRSSVDLSFAYGTDIDKAYRDASIRLDRAKRYLPDTPQPPIIYKRDPSQSPVMEYIISSSLRDPVELRSWTDYELAKWLRGVPGVAAAEVGGGLEKEFHILLDSQRLAGMRLSYQDVAGAVADANVDAAGGRLYTNRQQITSRTAGRIKNLAQLASLKIDTADGGGVRLDEIADVVESHADEQLRIRLNGIPGVKLSLQKQPQVNTVAVVENIKRKLQVIKSEGLIPKDITVDMVSDESVFVRHALSNAAKAAWYGALLAMLVVYVFLGDLRRTLIIGTAIPLAMVVAFIIMSMAGLSLNIMTLGGLALGVGILVDSTIVMLENIVRHQQQTKGEQPAIDAAKEVNSAIVASTTTNLAAVIPFVFIGGLVGLLFRELIFTICAAITASLLVAITVVPALAAKLPVKTSVFRSVIENALQSIARAYANLLSFSLRAPWLLVALFTLAMFLALPTFLQDKQIFLPNVDEGRIGVSIHSDPGISLDEMDAAVQRIETIILDQPETRTAFTTVGGFVYGRSEYQSSSYSSISVQLSEASRRTVSSEQWIGRVNTFIAQQHMAGFRVYMRIRGIRGIRLGRGDDSISLRLQGQDLDTLAKLADGIADKLKRLDALTNVEHNAENTSMELTVHLDRDRVRDLGLTVADIGRTVRRAIDGEIIGNVYHGDRSIDIRMRPAYTEFNSVDELRDIILTETEQGLVYLSDVAKLQFIPAPDSIFRDNQQRVVEISAGIKDHFTLAEASAAIKASMADVNLPAGYALYRSGAFNELYQSRRLSMVMLATALFLVFVVMAVQYESLTNPLIILLSVPLVAIGVALGIHITEIPLSMPVWLGMIMLAGLVVNNAIVLIEYIEIQKQHSASLLEAIVEAAQLRLRPILMTTLTTVVGMLPLAMNWGDGAELLQPLAITIVSGLSFSVLVSLLLVPGIYLLFHSSFHLRRGKSLVIRQPTHLTSPGTP